ncbi:MAG: tetratricopeptide repeat protein [Kiritimatiellae bacterium]|nr:tetratricopeptide repeat protein [Kiritimatiellia bacterium]
MSLRYTKDRRIRAAAGLVVLTLAVFGQVVTHEFVNFDDPNYISENRYVHEGLTLRNILWAFTAPDAEDWQPLVWMSHMADYGLYGDRPAGHLLTNVAIHTASALILFFLLARMTGGFWQSAFVAALFAIHPLRAESVAWAAERKDVLSTFFWLLTMWMYARYLQRRTPDRYAAVLAAYAGGLMSKPMLVTLPFALLLLDFWPLGRMAWPFRRAAGGTRANGDHEPFRRLALEKLPLLGLALAAVAVTVYVNYRHGIIKSLDWLPFTARVQNALVAYVRYLGKMVWPSGLAVFYPHPVAMLPDWQIVGSFLFLLLVSGLVLTFGRTARYLPAGWFWYLGTLVPVIGLVQVGFQAMADRYTYIPHIGISVMAAWGIPALVRRLPRARQVVAAGAAALVAVYAGVAWRQVGHWRNSTALFTHALAVTQGNYWAHNHLGMALAKRDALDEAIVEYREALRIWPDYSVARNNLASALANQGKLEAAIREFTIALMYEPTYVTAINNLGLAYYRKGDVERAVQHYSRALELNPRYIEPRLNLATALADLGRMQEAVAQFAKALRLDPNDAITLNRLGNQLARAGKERKAIPYYVAAIRADPACAVAHYNLGNALVALGQFDAAVKAFSTAVQIEPQDADAHENLALAFERQQKFEEAVFHFSEALRFKPNNAECHSRLGLLLARQGAYERAAFHLSAALQARPGRAGTHYNLSNVLRLLGRDDEAHRHLSEALRLQPNLLERRQRAEQALTNQPAPAPDIP